MSSNAFKSPCNICGELDAKDKDSFTFEPRAVVQAANRGCAVCQLLRNSLVHARPNFVSEVDKVVVEKKQSGPLSLTYLVKNSPSQETVEVYAHRGERISVRLNYTVHVLVKTIGRRHCRH
jgi:hypothetical protein